MGKSFSGKVVWITGASSGIGEALARAFAAQGAKLVLFARRAERLEALCAEFAKNGTEAQLVVGDVNRAEDLALAVDTARRRFGGLDVAIANAGFGVSGRIESLELADYRRQFETNVFAVIATAKAALPELEKSKGSLVLVGSVNGFVSLPGNSAYGMSKFAVRALAESLYLELRPKGVAVTHIAPGFVESEIRMVDNHGRRKDKVSRPYNRMFVVSATSAAKEIVRAVRWRRREKIVSNHGRAIVFFARYFRGLWFTAIRAIRITARPEVKG